MDWFRHYHGLCTDPKLHRVSREAGVSRAIVIAGWCAMLELASANGERGTAANLDAGTLAFMIDVKPSVAERVLAAAKKFGLIDDDAHILAWTKRQRASDDIHTRVASFRERKANALKANETGGSGNVTVTRQNRTDTDKKESPPFVPPAGGKAQAEPRRRTERKASQWPDDFELTPERREYAERKVPRVDALALWEGFEASAKANGRSYKDWDKAWVSWVISPHKKPMLNGASHRLVRPEQEDYQSMLLRKMKERRERDSANRL